jgi:predicted transcriptional regulator
MIVPVKQAVQDVLQTLPDDCSWEDVMYQLYVRREIDAGLRDIAEGRVVDHDEVFRELLGDEDHLEQASARPSSSH